MTALGATLMALGAGVANAAPCSVTDATFSSKYPEDQTNQQNADACSNALDGDGNTPNEAELNALRGPGFLMREARRNGHAGTPRRSDSAPFKR